MAGDGPGTDVTGAWRSMSHNKHWTKQKLAEARATWVRPNDEKTVVTLCTGSRCRKPLLPTAEQLERMVNDYEMQEAEQVESVNRPRKRSACAHNPCCSCGGTFTLEH